MPLPHRQEVVHVRERGLHAARQRLVARRSQQRVQPDQMMAAAGRRATSARAAPDRRDPSPSDTSSTTGPWRSAASPPAVVGAQRLADAGSAAPVRTARPTPVTASSILAADRYRVTRVSRVENRNASTSRGGATSACTNCSSILEYRSMEPLTSAMTTSGRVFSLRVRLGRTSGSPPCFMFRPHERPQVERARRPRGHRRVRRRPRPVQLAQQRRASAISSGVNRAKSLVRNASRGL